MSFWLPDAAAEGRESWHENDYCEIVRNVAGDLVENVSIVSGPLEWTRKPATPSSPTQPLTSPDRRLHPPQNRTPESGLPSTTAAWTGEQALLSYGAPLTRPRSLRNEDVNELQAEVEKQVVAALGIEMK
jgi:hypothetical protein